MQMDLLMDLCRYDWCKSVSKLNRFHAALKGIFISDTGQFFPKLKNGPRL